MDWPFATFLCVLTGVGVFAVVKLWLSDKSVPTKAAGTIMTLGTLFVAGGFSAVKEFKIDKFFDLGDVEVRIDQQLSEAAPRHLGTIRCYRAGKSDLPTTSETSDPLCFPDSVVESHLGEPHEKTLTADGWLSTLCPEKKDSSATNGKPENEGKSMILVIGATDRTRLSGKLPRQYDSNVGLAQARAEEVAARLRAGCQQVLALASGPKYTKEGFSNPEDHWQDRKVDIWQIGYRQTGEYENWFTRWWRAVSFQRKKEPNKDSNER